MYSKLIEIYQGKIVKPDDGFNLDNNYYFYNEHGKLFGISKTITNNEYLLIKSMYLEKTFHYDNLTLQKIHEFLHDNGKYPFAFSRGNFLLYHGVPKTDQEKIQSLLKDIFLNIETTSYLNTTIVFYFDKYDIEIGPLFKTISDDFGVNIYTHDGMQFSEMTKGRDIITYIKAFLSCPKLYKKDFSELSDLIFNLSPDNYFEVINIIKTNHLDKVFEKEENKEIIQVFFNNELNVSKSAKLLYMHRNSLINRLEILSKEIGLNLQRFNHAAAVKLLMNLNLGNLSKND